MQIFKNRPLCLIISLLTVFMAVSTFMSAATKLFTVLAAAGIFLFLLYRIKRDDTFGFRAGTLIIALILLACTAMRSYFYYDLKKYDIQRAVGVTSEAEIKITDITYSDNYITVLSGKMQKFSGEKMNLNVYLECEYMLDYESGDTVRFRVTAMPADTMLDDGYMTRLSLLSGGYDLYCTSYDDTARLVEKGHGIKYSLEQLNSKICAKFISLLGEESGALSSALALGNSKRVGDDVLRDFSRSGLSHILALSGSHIVLVIGAVEAVLRKFAKMGKKIRYPIMLLSLPLYIILVMSPIPVIRAGLMYGMFCLLQLVNKKSDSMTNLFISAFVMIMAEPSCVFSISLWMSFVATLALIVFLPSLNKMIYNVKSKNKGKLPLLFVISVTSSAVVALIGWLSNIVFMPVFGTLSTVSVFTNVIFGPMLTLYLVLSMALVMLMPIPFLARLLAIPVAKFGELILFCINRSATYKYSVISLKWGFAETVCIAFFVFAVVFLIVKVKRKSIILIPVAMLSLLLLANTSILSAGDGNVHVTNIKHSQNEAFTVSYGDSFSVIDVSNGRLSSLTGAAKEAKANGACEFESLVLTHYHRYHVSTVRRFLQRETVRNVLIPTAVNDYDREIQGKLAAMLDSLGVPYCVYDTKAIYQIADNVYLKAFPIERIKRSTHALISFSIFFEEDVFTYVGASVNDGRICDSVKTTVFLSEKVILGRHGPIQKTSPSYSFADGADVYINDELIREKYYSSENSVNATADIDGIIKFYMDGKKEVDKN